MAVMNHLLFAHTRLVPVIATVYNQAYLPGTGNTVLLPGTHMFDRTSFSCYFI